MNKYEVMFIVNQLKRKQLTLLKNEAFIARRRHSRKGRSLGSVVLLTL